MQQQPPNNQPGYPPQWQQPNTQYPPQQPFQAPPGYQPYQQPPMVPQRSPKPPKKRRNILFAIGISALILIVSFLGYERTLAVPQLTSQQIKANAQDTTVQIIDKDGNDGKGQSVHFTSTISSFVKDGSGNTAGANVRDTGTSTFAVIQVAFPAGTDIAKINQGDTLEVWGTDQGVFSGQNAFGGTVQEVEVEAVAMTDVTTGYGVAP